MDDWMFICFNISFNHIPSSRWMSMWMKTSCFYTNNKLIQCYTMCHPVQKSSFYLGRVVQITQWMYLEKNPNNAQHFLHATNELQMRGRGISTVPNASHAISVTPIQDFIRPRSGWDNTVQNSKSIDTTAVADLGDETLEHRLFPSLTPKNTTEKH